MPEPVDIGGLRVNSGDMIVADQDGVVVVPYESIDAVIERLATIQELETALDAEVSEGLSVPQAIVDLLDSPSTRFVDD